MTAQGQNRLQQKGAIDLLILAAIAIISLAIPFSAKLVQQKQDFRKSAQECVTNSDCPADHPSCDGGSCKGGGCVDDSGCASWEVCQNGGCRSKAGCTRDSDCADGKKCNGGVCEDSVWNAQCGGTQNQCPCGNENNPSYNQCFSGVVYKCGNDCCLHASAEKCEGSQNCLNWGKKCDIGFRCEDTSSGPTCVSEARPTPTPTITPTLTPTPTPTEVPIQGCLNPSGSISQKRCEGNDLYECSQAGTSFVWELSTHCPYGCNNGSCVFCFSDEWADYQAGTCQCNKGVGTKELEQKNRCGESKFINIDCSNECLDQVPTLTATPTPAPAETPRGCSNPSGQTGDSYCRGSDLLTCAYRFGAHYWDGRNCPYGCQDEGGNAYCKSVTLPVTPEPIKTVIPDQSIKCLDGEILVIDMEMNQSCVKRVETLPPAVSKEGDFCIPFVKDNCPEGTICQPFSCKKVAATEITAPALITTPTPSPMPTKAEPPQPFKEGDFCLPYLNDQCPLGTTCWLFACRPSDKKEEGKCPFGEDLLYDQNGEPYCFKKKIGAGIPTPTPTLVTIPTPTPAPLPAQCTPAGGGCFPFINDNCCPFTECQVLTCVSRVVQIPTPPVLTPTPTPVGALSCAEKGEACYSFLWFQKKCCPGKVCKDLSCVYDNVPTPTPTMTPIPTPTINPEEIIQQEKALKIVNQMPQAQKKTQQDLLNIFDNSYFEWTTPDGNKLKVQVPFAETTDFYSFPQLTFSQDGYSSKMTLEEAEIMLAELRKPAEVDYIVKLPRMSFGLLKQIEIKKGQIPLDQYYKNIKDGFEECYKKNLLEEANMRPECMAADDKVWAQTLDEKAFYQTLREQGIYWDCIGSVYNVLRTYYDDKKGNGSFDKYIKQAYPQFNKEKLQPSGYFAPDDAISPTFSIPVNKETPVKDLKPGDLLILKSKNESGVEVGVHILLYMGMKPNDKGQIVASFMENTDESKLQGLHLFEMVAYPDKPLYQQGKTDLTVSPLSTLPLESRGSPYSMRLVNPIDNKPAYEIVRPKIFQ